MKRYIKASKHSRYSMDKDLKFIKMYGQALAEVVDAETLEEIQDALSLVFGKSVIKHLDDKASAIKAIVDNIGFVTSEYLLTYNAEKKRPEVIETLVDYLKGLGYDVRKMKTAPRGYDDSYVIVPADECDFEDIKTVASAVAHDFGLRPDTGIIGGSWTSYEFKMDGVPFRIGFERDYDFDDSGKESSLQLYL